jgi:hypothetical protein
MLAAMRKCAVTLKMLAHFQVVWPDISRYSQPWGVCVGGPFGTSKELGVFKSAATWGRWGWKAGRHWKANRLRKQIEEQYDAETAEAVAAAIASGRNPEPILERAERRKAEGVERRNQVDGGIR